MTKEPTVLAMKQVYLICTGNRHPMHYSGYRNDNTYVYSSCKHREKFTRRAQWTSSGFHNLPQEVLVRVFSHFSEHVIANVLMHVCQHWRLAATHPSLWHHLRFQGPHTPLDDICRLLYHSSCLRTIEFVAVPGIVRALRQVCRCNPELHHISVKYCTREHEWIPESVLKNLIVSCPKLRSLNLKGTQFRTGRLLNELVYLPQLQSLKFSLHTGVRPRDLVLMALNCRGLQELAVCPCRSRGPRAPLCELEVAFLLDNVKHSLVSLSFDMHGLGELVLQIILSCSMLRSLKLANCIRISGPVFRSIPGNLAKLTRLQLTNACQLTTEDVRNVFADQDSPLRNLTYLDLSGCCGLRDDGLRCIADATSATLGHLGLERCKAVTALGVEYALRLCQNLRHLNIAHTFLLRLEHSQNICLCAPHLQVLVLGKYEEGAVAYLKQQLLHLKIAVVTSEFSKRKYDFML